MQTRIVGSSVLIFLSSVARIAPLGDRNGVCLAGAGVLYFERARRAERRRLAWRMPRRAPQRLVWRCFSWGAGRAVVPVFGILFSS